MTGTAHPAPGGALPEGAGCLRLALTPGISAVEPAREAVLAFLAPLAMSLKAIYVVELVLEETLMNLGWHAFGDALPHEVRLAVQVAGDRVVLHFDDDGLAFDPTQAAEPAPPTSLQDARPGGLGLKLVRRFAEHIAYQRRDGHNHLAISIARQ